MSGDAYFYRPRAIDSLFNIPQIPSAYVIGYSATYSYLLAASVPTVDLQAVLTNYVYETPQSQELLYAVPMISMSAAVATYVPSLPGSSVAFTGLAPTGVIV